jgi:hypothetical protein
MPIIRFVLIALLVSGGLHGTSAAGPPSQSSGESRTAANRLLSEGDRKSAAEVLEAHKKELLNIPGISGVGLEQSDSGKMLIDLWVDDAAQKQDLNAPLPKPSKE